MPEPQLFEDADTVDEILEDLDHLAFFGRFARAVEDGAEWNELRRLTETEAEQLPLPLDTADDLSFGEWMESLRREAEEATDGG